MRALGVGSTYRNAAYPLVSEYLMRQRLHKIGFTAKDLETLDPDKAQGFLIISNSLDKIKREAEEKAMKKGRK